MPRPSNRAARGWTSGSLGRAPLFFLNQYRLHFVNWNLRVISRKAIREFTKKHPDSLPSLSNWHVITRRAAWKNLAGLHADFASADRLGRRTVFNIAGNKYRLIARVNYRVQRVYILWIMKHAEYTKGEWK
jgi:mRNA interferase HigB